MASLPKNTVFVSVFIVFMCGHLYVFGSQRLYPILDAPNHLALASIYRFYDDPDNKYERYYDLNVFPKPNVSHMIFCGASFFPTVSFGNKCFYLLYASLFMLSVLLLILRCGGNIWYSLFAFLLLYNVNVGYGFVGFTIALPFILILLYLTINVIEETNKRSAYIVLMVLFLLFFMHAMAFLFASMIYGTCILYYNVKNKSFFNGLRQTLPCIPAGILFFVWWIIDSREYDGQGMLTSLLNYYSTAYFPSFWRRGAVLVHDNFRLVGGVLGYATAAFFSLTIMLTAVVSVWRQKHNFKVKAQSVPVTCVLLFLFCSMLCVVVMPDVLPGYSFLSQRFSVLFLLGFIILGSLFAPKNLSGQSVACLSAVVFVHWALWANCFAAFDRDNKGFDETFFSDCRRTDIVAGLIFDYRFRGVSVYDNFTDYYTAWNKGISTTRLIDDRSFAISRKVNTNILPEYLGWIGKTKNGYDGRYENVDYILVRENVRPDAVAYMKNFYVVKKSGAWSLYRNKNRRDEAPHDE